MQLAKHLQKTATMRDVYSPGPTAHEYAWSSPMLLSKVIAFILSEHKIASLSTRLLSSPFELRAERMTHMSQRLMWTARRLGRFSGEPWNIIKYLTARRTLFKYLRWTVSVHLWPLTNYRPMWCLVWFILRPCQHNIGYIDGQSQI